MDIATSVSELKKRLNAVICPSCIDVNPDGTCGLDRVEECPITSHLNKLVEVAATVNSRRMDEYVDAVRANVCHECKNRVPAAHEACEVRNEGHCALDAFLLPAVQVVDDFIASIEERAGLRPKSI